MYLHAPSKSPIPGYPGYPRLGWGSLQGGHLSTLTPTPLYPTQHPMGFTLPLPIPRWMRRAALRLGARARLANCRRGEALSLSFNVELQDLVDCMCEDARPVVSTAGRNSSISSRLHFPGFAPKSRQIARRGSALSLPHGILDWSPS